MEKMRIPFTFITVPKPENKDIEDKIDYHFSKINTPLKDETKSETKDFIISNAERFQNHLYLNLFL